VIWVHSKKQTSFKKSTVLATDAMKTDFI